MFPCNIVCSKYVVYGQYDILLVCVHAKGPEELIASLPSFRLFSIVGNVNATQSQILLLRILCLEGSIRI